MDVRSVIYIVAFGVGFLTQFGVYIWRVSKMESRLEIELTTIKTHVEYLRKNGVNALTKAFEDCKDDKEERLRKLEQEGKKK